VTRGHGTQRARREAQSAKTSRQRAELNFEYRISNAADSITQQPNHSSKAGRSAVMKVIRGGAAGSLLSWGAEEPRGRGVETETRRGGKTDKGRKPSHGSTETRQKAVSSREKVASILVHAH